VAPRDFLIAALPWMVMADLLIAIALGGVALREIYRRPAPVRTPRGRARRRNRPIPIVAAHPEKKPLIARSSTLNRVAP
jgi:hypothetical protein